MSTQEVVTFYAFDKENKTGLGVTVSIRGGERSRDANGNKYSTEYVSAQFRNGIYRTSNPVIIEGLRKIAADKHSGITEDYEVYLDAILQPTEKERRLKAQLSEMREEKNRLLEKIKPSAKQEAKKEKDAVAV